MVLTTTLVLLEDQPQLQAKAQEQLLQHQVVPQQLMELDREVLQHQALDHQEVLLGKEVARPRQMAAAQQ